MQNRRISTPKTASDLIKTGGKDLKAYLAAKDDRKHEKIAKIAVLVMDRAQRGKDVKGLFHTQRFPTPEYGIDLREGNELIERLPKQEWLSAFSNSKRGERSPIWDACIEMVKTLAADPNSFLVFPFKDQIMPYLDQYFKLPPGSRSKYLETLGNLPGADVTARMVRETLVRVILRHGRNCFGSQGWYGAFCRDVESAMAGSFSMSKGLPSPHVGQSPSSSGGESEGQKQSASPVLAAGGSVSDPNRRIVLFAHAVAPVFASEPYAPAAKSERFSITKVSEKLGGENAYLTPWQTFGFVP
ncbi:hypothetical protein EBR96_06380, partial [bacterium]|nr:hypothetical protein [bacterium]